MVRFPFDCTGVYVIHEDLEIGLQEVSHAILS